MLLPSLPWWSLKLSLFKRSNGYIISPFLTTFFQFLFSFVLHHKLILTLVFSFIIFVVWTMASFEGYTRPYSKLKYLIVWVDGSTVETMFFSMIFLLVVMLFQGKNCGTHFIWEVGHPNTTTNLIMPQKCGILRNQFLIVKISWALFQI